MGYLFFDCASTTQCCPAADEAMRQFSVAEYGNPSSRHAMGQKSARAISDARKYFGEVFDIDGRQAGRIIFTGSGTESDNLAISGVLRPFLIKGKKPRVICSSIEHPAVGRSVMSWADFGFDVWTAPVDENGQIIENVLLDMITDDTALVSIMCVNNIVGTIQPVEGLARAIKAKNPNVVFHTDAVQAFSKVTVPKGELSAVDLVSISAHKIEGPKGIGALVVLNPKLISERRLHPVIFGGGQEWGLRSGTQNAGLIAGFQAATQQALSKNSKPHLENLRGRLRTEIAERQIPVKWISPDDAVPYIVNLAVPGRDVGKLSSALEERGVLISLGSACSSQKGEPDPVLAAMGLAPEVYSSSIRVSFCDAMQEQDVTVLAGALAEALQAAVALDSGAAATDPVANHGSAG